MDANLIGKPLRYLIGADGNPPGADGVVTEVGYDAVKLPRGIGIKYGNLLDEKNKGKYGPYLRATGTAAQYQEGLIDPKGAGWLRNIDDQIARAKAQGFQYIEWDNPDSYAIKDVLGAIVRSAAAGLRVIAKNAMLIDGRGTTAQYLAHPNVFGCIVEKDAGKPASMNDFRVAAGKPHLPVWFVAFGDGRSWANSIASRIAVDPKTLGDMGVTYCDVGEYRIAKDVYVPHTVV